MAMSEAAAGESSVDVKIQKKKSRARSQGLSNQQLASSAPQHEEQGQQAGRAEAEMEEDGKQRGLTREFRSNFKPTREQFFVSHAHSQRVHSAAAGLLKTALYTSERESKADTTPLCTILRSGRQVDCARKNLQLTDLIALIKSLR